jgi:APA family basic amino acid/polyamine antiporter
MPLFAKKPLLGLLQEAGGEHHLRRVLGPVGLTSLGVGAIIGAGIFVLTGAAAAKYAGPAIVLSFVISGLGCTFAGLCYAEMAAMIPIAGSAYTYSYATMGELLAWIIGWDLILEYSFGASTVAVGWSGYVVSFLHDLGFQMPPELIAAPGTKLIEIPSLLAGRAAESFGLSVGWQTMTDDLVEFLQRHGLEAASFTQATAVINVPAMLIVGLITVLLVLGISESAKVNNAVVILKVSIVLIFIAAGSSFLLGHTERFTENWKEFIPENKGKFGEFGWSGIFRAAGVIFFAYIGFDAVSTAAQEAKNPQKHMPVGILGSLLICTILYIIMAVVMTGLVHYSQLAVPHPVAVSIDATGMRWLAPWIKIGAIAGLSSVILVMLLAQPRIFWTMSRDGLLPGFFAHIHPRFRTPYITTIMTGLVVAVIAGLVPIHILGELVSIGTLLAFVLVCAGVLVLRYTNPEIERPFKAPAVHLTALLGILICLSQMVALPLDTWLRLIVWLALGLAIYFSYGIRHSKLAQPARAGDLSRIPVDEHLQKVPEQQ